MDGVDSQSLNRPVSRRGEHGKILTASRPSTSMRKSTSARPLTMRPPSALSGGTATRLTSAIHTSNSAVSNQRIGTAIGFADNLSERVLTQHGLSGIPSVKSRIGTSSGMRQIKDIRYWQSHLQMKMDEICKETERLVREKTNMDREKSAKRAFEKKVKESTRELTVLQGKLSDMNIALDSTNSNVDRQQMIQEASVLRERNEQKQQQLENAFSERQTKEMVNKRLEEEIDLERNKMNKVIEAMDPVDQEKYLQYDQLAQKLCDENNQMHEEINSMLNRKTILETMIKGSPERIEAVRMLSKLNDMEMNLMATKKDEQHRLTPAQEREKLINDVRVNKQALTSIQHQIKIAEDTLTEKRGLLKQFDDDLDENSSERYAKYKELKHRDEMMSKFMDNFKESFTVQKKKIELIKNQMTSAIEQVTMNGVNLKSLGLSKIPIDDDYDLSSEDGILKEYKRLSIQLKQLQILRKRTIDQIQKLKQDKIDITNDMQKFANLQALRTESAAKYEQLSSKLEDLKQKKCVIEDVVKEAHHRNEEIKDQLKSNDNFRQISHLEERLSELIEETKDVTSTWDQLQKEINHDDIMNEAKGKLLQLSEMLQAAQKPLA